MNYPVPDTPIKRLKLFRISLREVSTSIRHPQQRSHPTLNIVIVGTYFRFGGILTLFKASLVGNSPCSRHPWWDTHPVQGILGTRLTLFQTPLVGYSPCSRHPWYETHPVPDTLGGILTLFQMASCPLKARAKLMPVMAIQSISFCHRV